MTVAHVLDHLGAYCLDALDPEDQAMVESHLASCDTCVSLIEGYREAASALALGVPAAQPDTELRTQLLDAARRDLDSASGEESSNGDLPEPLSLLKQNVDIPSAAPDGVAPSEVQAVEPELSAVRWGSVRPAAIGRESIVAGEPTVASRPGPMGPATGPAPLDAVRRRPIPWANLSGAVAAAVMVLALGWGILVQRRLDSVSAQNQTLTARGERYDQLLRVLAAANYQERPLGSPGGSDAWGRVIFDADSGTGMLMVHQRPPPSPGMEYQVWVGVEESRVSVGSLRTDAQGSGYVILRADQPFGTFETLGVTQEPAGASAAPSGPPVLSAELRSP